MQQAPAQAKAAAHNANLMMRPMLPLTVYGFLLCNRSPVSSCVVKIYVLYVVIQRQKLPWLLQQLAASAVQLTNVQAPNGITC